MREATRKRRRRHHPRLAAAVLGIPLIVALAMVSPLFSAEPFNLAEALEAQQQLAAATPTPETLTDLGNLLVMAGNGREAESSYRRAMAMDAEHVGAPFNLGLLMQYRGETESASMLFEQVIALDAQHAWAHYQLGSIHEAAANRRKAIDEYARALAIDPELYFADVNPQILDNKLVTEALLEAAKLRQPARLAPMSFSRPREITRLLLSLPGVEGDADGNGEGEGEGEGEGDEEIPE